MTKEQYFFLNILSDHLHGKMTEITGEYDWKQILDYAHSHQVEGILYYQCQKYIRSQEALKSVDKRLKELYASNIFYYSNRVSLSGLVQKAFEEKEISFFTVKGLNVSRYYPVPMLRTMGDSDILVHPEDKEKAHEVMKSLGFRCDQKLDQDWTYFKNQLEFEIHDHLLYDTDLNTVSGKEFSDMAWTYAKSVSGKYQYELDWNFHFIFLLLHLRKHILYSGAGFRQFMDLAVVVQHVKMDWDWLVEKLEELELLDFTKICFSFISRWFSVEMPLQTWIDESLFEKSTQKIFANGVFGDNDAENQENANLDAVRKYGKIRTVIQRIFPSYKDISMVSHYSFLKGRPWLLPAVWCYRFYYGIKHKKGKEGRKLLTDAFVSEDKIKGRETILKQWGL